jgi:hypothetical protein
VTAGLPVAAFGDAPAAAGRLLDGSALGAIELDRPPLDDLPYRDFVRTLLARAPGFKLDFHGRTPDAALAMVADRVLGPASFARERALLAEDIDALKTFAQTLVGGPPAQVSIRTYFAPGDLVWHLDRVNEARAVRLLWPLGRAAGMRVTPADNIDPDLYRGYARREHPLLCQLDTRVLRTGGDVEALWSHRPVQLAAMRSGRFPFLRDPEQLWAVRPDAASIHRIETPAQRGAWHRSSWENRGAPGLQIVVTAVADR